MGGVPFTRPLQACLKLNHHVRLVRFLSARAQATLLTRARGEHMRTTLTCERPPSWSSKVTLTCKTAGACMHCTRRVCNQYPLAPHTELKPHAERPHLHLPHAARLSVPRYPQPVSLCDADVSKYDCNAQRSRGTHVWNRIGTSSGTKLIPAARPLTLWRSL